MASEEHAESEMGPADASSEDAPGRISHERDYVRAKTYAYRHGKTYKEFRAEWDRDHPNWRRDHPEDNDDHDDDDDEASV